MTTEIEYALMAGASYISTRDPINQFPVPSDWSENIKKEHWIQVAVLRQPISPKVSEKGFNEIE